MLRRVDESVGTSPEQQGLTNCYKCSKCNHVDKYCYADSGTTPMIVECTHCKNRSSVSAMMRDLLPLKKPDQEWFRPSLKETLKLAGHPDILYHILKGGLLRRPYDPLRNCRCPKK